MPFQTLLFDSLMPGSSFRESGSSVSVQPVSGETVLFFRLDQPFSEATGIRRFLQRDQPVSDLLVFYRKAENFKPRLCLVELKGADLRHAVEQLIATKTAIVSQLKGVDVGRGKRPEVEWQAIIRTSGSSPPALDKAKVAKAFGGRFKVTRQDDIGELLRQ